MEEAANELINMLLESEQQREAEQKLLDESRAESKAEPADSEGDWAHLWTWLIAQGS